MEDPFRLDGKIALVTGGTSGIGFAIVERLLHQGARVVISSESPSAVASVGARWPATTHGVVADVSDLAACQRLIEQAVRWQGSLDILVCAAGIPGEAGPDSWKNFADYEAVLNVNLRGMVAIAAHAMPFLAQTQGSAILIGSIAGSRGNASINAYALAKAGVLQLARNLAVQWGPRGVRVNSLSPGLIAAGIARPLLDNQSFMDRRLSMTPLRRTGTAAEVADSVAFLASAAAGFITGHDLVVDGGTLITDGS